MASWVVEGCFPCVPSDLVNQVINIVKVELSEDPKKLRGHEQEGAAILHRGSQYRAAAPGPSSF